MILEHVKALLNNDCIEICKRMWGSSVVLATKPHQEHIKDTDNFVWRMCISYRRLWE